MNYNESVADTARLAKTGVKALDKAKDVANAADAMRALDTADEAISFVDDVQFPSIKYPGDDPSISPGDGFEWRGKYPPSEGLGAWYNPEKNVSFHWDLNHKEPIPPHWDYVDEYDNVFRIYKDGNIELSKIGGKRR